MEQKRTLVLLGDSSIDNSYWVDKGDSVADKLRKNMGETHEVVDLSNDGFTTEDVLKGQRRNKVFVVLTTPRHTREFFKPMEALEKVETIDHLVISVGGNDIREKLQELQNPNAQKREELLNTFIQQMQKNYIEILDQIAKRQVKPILMLQYFPDAVNDHYKIYQLMKTLAGAQSIDAALQFLSNMMRLAYQPILAYAKERGFPIIDLASSLNFRDSSLYVSQIEPSAKGGEQIARLIQHVVQQHNYQGPSMLYATPDTSGEIVAIETNHETWRPHFQQPDTEDSAKAMFVRVYESKVRAEHSRFFGLGYYLPGARPKSLETIPPNFADIVEHARNNGERSMQVMKNLGWMDDDDQITLQFTDSNAPGKK